jgi:hypothetical protein
MSIYPLNYKILDLREKYNNLIDEFTLLKGHKLEIKVLEKVVKDLEKALEI